jgi:hypothetical protein
VQFNSIIFNFFIKIRLPELSADADSVIDANDVNGPAKFGDVLPEQIDALTRGEICCHVNDIGARGPKFLGRLRQSFSRGADDRIAITGKQYNTLHVNVGTVEKSMAAIASR